jgi:hypothetical protein
MCVQFGIISAAKTRTIQDNGFNPTFGEKGQGETFTFDIQVCVSVSMRVDVYRCVSALCVSPVCSYLFRCVSAYREMHLYLSVCFCFYVFLALAVVCALW